MNKKTKSGIILTSLVSIAFAGSLLAGSTYALFTSESTTNIAVNSGTVDVTATIENMLTYTGNDLTGVVTDDESKIKLSTDYNLTNGQFKNGGTASLSEGTLTLDKMTPGDKVTFTIKLENKSNVDIKYRTVITCEEDDGLLSGLEFTIGGTSFDGLNNKSPWKELSANQAINNNSLDCVVNLPSSAGNKYQEKKCKVSYTIEAIQGNAATSNPDENVIEIDNAAQLGVFRDMVNSYIVKNDKGEFYDNGGQLTYFGGKTVKLMNDIDLDGANWAPIIWANSSANFTFDGNNKTISNFVSERYDDINKAVGFFAYATGATIKNLKIDGATINGVNHSGAVVGNALCTKIENCHVSNSTITSSYLNGDDGDKAGAIVGYLSAEPGAHLSGSSATNCTVKGYRDIGGLVGYLNTNTSSTNEIAYVTGNSITNTTIINDRSNNYKSYTTDEKFDVNEVVGEQAILEGKTAALSLVKDNTINDVKINVTYADGFNYELSTGKFYITSKEGMFNFASYVNSGNTMLGKTVELRENVDLENEPWQPIMNFQGIFDGLRNNIKNLYIEWNKTTEYGNWGPQYLGLFGKCDFNSEADLIIKNFSITNAYVKGGNYGMYSGIVLGNGTANIDNVTINGLVKIESNSWYVGGIAGGTYVKCNNCHINASDGSYIKTTNSGNVGGIVGLTGEQNIAKYIKNCSVKNLTISGNSYVGGITGTLHTNMNIEGCTVSKCTINGDENVGVFYGRLCDGGVCDETKNTKTNVTINGQQA